MRRKPTSQGSGGYNNQHRRPRYQGGSNGGSQGHHNHHRGGPRKNYGAMREKYLAQARDALASGDRVLAENYYQHADHCYRMMVEEGQFQPRPVTAPQQGAEGQPQAAQPDQQPEQFISENTNQLPAFITATHEVQNAPAVDPATIQNWEDRDA